MNNLILEIKNTLNEELKSINHKIRGTGFLEILKYRLIDRLHESLKLKSFNIIEDINIEQNYEDSEKKISARLFYNKSPKISLSNKLDNNILIICFNENIFIDIENNTTNNKINMKLIPFTGITLSKDTLCNLNYSKNSSGLEINCIEKNLNIEKLN